MKKKLTFIDYLIILILVVALTAGAVVLFPHKSDADEENKDKTAHFTIMLSSMENGFSDSISVGDEISLSYTEKGTGTIKEISCEPAQILTFDSIGGRYKLESSEENEDIYLNVVATVTEDELLIKADEVVLKVGMEVYVRGKGYVANGFITDIETVD